MEQIRQLIHITGIVQGVGFRPFIYKLAKQYQLSGYVLNNGDGVSIEVEGEERKVTAFYNDIILQAPPLSRIDSITAQAIAVVDALTFISDNALPEHTPKFIITESDSSQSATVCVSPDQGICPACLDDINDPTNRHYRYPFTNCTHCGPRYTLIKQLPYDRKQTSMAAFAMCPDCEAAYTNPEDRRYHAQPVSCPKCGPWVRFYDLENKKNQPEPIADHYAAIEATAAALNAGKIIAVKGLGGFHLMCDATNQQAVAQLRLRKQRQRKPLAVMMKDTHQAQGYIEGSPQEWALLGSQQRPITLFRKKASCSDYVSDADFTITPRARADIADIADNVAPNIPYLGVMLPYTPLHYLLFDLVDVPLVATSANISGFPIIANSDDIFRQLGHVVDGVLDHNREIVHCCDDSLVQVAGGRRQTLRLARGYAPYTFSLPHKLTHPVLAVGGQQKVTFGLGFAEQGIISPHVGDMFGLDMQQHYQQMLNGFTHIYHVKPQTIVCDKHPNYMTTEWAQDYVKGYVQDNAQGNVQKNGQEAAQENSPDSIHTNNQDSSCEKSTPLLQLQHHHAHIVAVMAEHQMRETVLGFAFDGTGLGDDHQIWGGEVLLADHQTAKRLYHLKPFRLIGGERAIKEPARILLGLLLEYYSFEQIKAFQLEAFACMPNSKFDNLYRLWLTEQSSPYTTSMGRLVDAFASLLGLVEQVDFEGECGMRLEALAIQADADKGAEPPSSPAFFVENDVIDPQPLLANVIDSLATSTLQSACSDLTSGPSIFTSKRTLAIKQNAASQFFTALVEMISTISAKHPEYPVVVSGGVFQNCVLMDRLDARFTSDARSFLTSEIIPLNDGGIAMGQLWHGLWQ
ncbi:carbamoyltransferase HypF [Photobacterium sanguinicancri]|uniref:carbamoyltransferase HypF n=1 Tax=Photobacterium sanguinicancri TaxID=875932 RepID=UPI003D1236D0